MPRTKVAKSSKRNREIENLITERLREYDAAADESLCQMDVLIGEQIEDFYAELSLIRNRLPKKLLTKTLTEIISNDDGTIVSLDSCNNSRFNGSALPTGTVQRQKSRDDEGYLTEENSNVGSVVSKNSSIIIGRTPGPLNSARARRRSRSAGGYFTKGNLIKPKPSAVPHSARAQTRAPRTPLPRSFSADRSPSNPLLDDIPLALYRWPKPGETIVSLTGSPIVSQMTSDVIPNVNIPIDNGVLSLRPVKMGDKDRNFVQKINPETLKQIRQLQNNLSFIIRYAENK